MSGLIACDVDDVLLDFLAAVDQWLGGVKNPHIPITWENLAARYGLAPSGMWDQLDSPDFWGSIPLFSGAEDFVAGLAELAPVILVTGLPHWIGGASVGAKRQKILSWFGGNIKGLHLVDGPKPVLANAVLIDDKEATVRAWQDAGASAVLFPAPHNSAAPWLEVPRDRIYSVILSSVKKEMGL